MSVKQIQSGEDWVFLSEDRSFGGKLVEALRVKGDGSGLVTGNFVVPAADIQPGAVGTTQLAAGAVTKAKTKQFISTVQTGTGASQNIAHGLGVVPTLVLVAPYTTSTAYSCVEGSHTNVNVVVTVTAAATFKVLAWA